MLNVCFDKQFLYAVRLEVIRKEDDGVIEILFGYPVNLAPAMEVGRKKSPEQQITDTKNDRKHAREAAHSR